MATFVGGNLEQLATLTNAFSREGEQVELDGPGGG
jgi:hypothetical protein